jgi:hypothetical protein
MSTHSIVPTLRPLIAVVREEVASSWPGRELAHSTAIRWVTRGVSDGQGGRIRLRAQRGPACWLVRREWVREFLDALAAARTPHAHDSFERRRTAEGVSS